MITAVPRHWYSWGYALTDGKKSLADIDISTWREKGEVRIANIPYRVFREAPFRGAFVLKSNSSVIARAQKPSSFSRRMLVEHGKVQYELKPLASFSRKFRLMSGTTVVGTLSPAAWWSRRMNVDLSDDLPLPLRTFVVWLTLILWKREWDSAA